MQGLFDFPADLVDFARRIAGKLDEPRLAGLRRKCPSIIRRWIKSEQKRQVKLGRDGYEPLPEIPFPRGILDPLDIPRDTVLVLVSALYDRLLARLARIGPWGGPPDEASFEEHEDHLRENGPYIVLVGDRINRLTRHDLEDLDASLERLATCSVQEAAETGTRPACAVCGEELPKDDADRAVCVGCNSNEGKLGSVSVAIKSQGDAGRIHDWRVVRGLVRELFGEHFDTDDEVY